MSRWGSSFPMTADIRWQQRFSNYRKALAQLETFFQPPALNDREQQGLIKAFEYTFELAWNTLRDLLRSQGNATLLGSRDTLREAFRLGLIEDGERWMQMIHRRGDCGQHQQWLHALFSATPGSAQRTPGAGARMSDTDPLAIPGIPSLRLQQLQTLFSKQPALDAVWLFGSRAMGRHHNGSDIDLCLEGTGLNHQGRLRLMAEVDELLMPWAVHLAREQHAIGSWPEVQARCRSSLT